MKTLYSVLFIIGIACIASTSFVKLSNDYIERNGLFAEHEKKNPGVSDEKVNYLQGKVIITEIPNQDNNFADETDFNSVLISKNTEPIHAGYIKSGHTPDEGLPQSHYTDMLAANSEEIKNKAVEVNNHAFQMKYQCYPDMIYLPCDTLRSKKYKDEIRESKIIF